MSKKLHISLIFSNLVVTKNIKFKPSYVQPLYKIRKRIRDAALYTFIYHYTFAAKSKYIII